LVQIGAGQGHCRNTSIATSIGWMRRRLSGWLGRRERLTAAELFRSTLSGKLCLRQGAMMTAPLKWQLAPEFAIGSKANKACKDKSIVRGLAYHQKVYTKLRGWLKLHPELNLVFHEEPWLRCLTHRQMCQPDGVLLDPFTNGAIVVEAKLNWKDGRDQVLLNTYLQAVRSAYVLTATWPLLITSNVRGYKGQPLLGLKQLEEAFAWKPGNLTPVLLLP
jgi:hypothetical protein